MAPAGELPGLWVQAMAGQHPSHQHHLPHHTRAGAAIPRSHWLPCPAMLTRGATRAHPRSEASGVDPGGTRHGSNNSLHRLPEGEHPGTALSTASAGAGAGRLLSISAEGTVPAQCLGVGPLARRLGLLPDTHHRGGGHGAGRHMGVISLRASDAQVSAATHSNARPIELPGQGPQPLTALMT